MRYCVERSDVRASGWSSSPVVFDASLDRIEAHAWYKNWLAAGDEDDNEDDNEDDPDGYTVDVPPSQLRR